MDMISPESIKRVYSGKPGCGCGCRGKYSEDPKTIKLIVGKMNRMNADKDVRIGCTDGEIFFVETPTRNYWAYTTAYQD